MSILSNNCIIGDQNMIEGEGAGKGDTPRPGDKTKFDKTYIKTFGDRDIGDFQKGKKSVTVYPKKKNK